MELEAFGLATPARGLIYVFVLFTYGSLDFEEC